MSNAKTSQLIDAALKQQAERTAVIVDNAVRSMAALMARDIVTICARLDALEKAIAPVAKQSKQAEQGSRASPTG